MRARDALTPAARRLPLARQVAALLGLQGQTQTSLAAEIGCSSAQLSLVLGGHRRSRRVVDGVARWAGVDADALEDELQPTAEGR